METPNLIEDKIFALKKMGLRWSILMCFYQTLCYAKVNISQSVDDKLQVARCIIESDCREIGEAEHLLDDIGDTLVNKTNNGRIENINKWIRLLDKKNFLDTTEIKEIPLMKALTQKYEFLSYCI